MNYTESSAFRTKSGHSLSGKYVAESLSQFPWGPRAPQQNIPRTVEYVRVDLLDTYIILEFGMVQPVYEGARLASPESVSILSAIIRNKWLQYKDRTGNLVLCFSVLRLELMTTSYGAPKREKIRIYYLQYEHKFFNT